MPSYREIKWKTVIVEDTRSQYFEISKTSHTVVNVWRKFSIAIFSRKYGYLQNVFQGSIHRASIEIIFSDIAQSAPALGKSPNKDPNQAPFESPYFICDACYAKLECC